MKKQNISGSVQTNDFGKQKQIKINIDNSNVFDLCMTLVLLKECLVDKIELNFKNFTFILKNYQDNYSVYDQLDLIKGHFKGAISSNALEYIIYFLLKYYRDGFSETQHIDIDFINGKREECTLTFMCGKFYEYSEQEIKKILK